MLGDGKEEALVTLNYSTGGTESWNFLYVYQFKDGHPDLLEILEAGSRGRGGLIKASTQNGLLVADFADEDKLQGDCCSSGYVRVRYRWTRGSFVETGDREYGEMKLRDGR